MDVSGSTPGQCEPAAQTAVGGWVMAESAFLQLRCAIPDHV